MRRGRLRLDPRTAAGPRLHLLLTHCGPASGAAWLSAGLHLSRVVGGGPSAGTVQWGPLRANVLGCALLVLLRGAERLGLAPRHSLVAAKLRTSGCGALSTSGGLAQLHATLYARGRRTPALVNFALHAYLSTASYMLLPAPVSVAHTQYNLTSGLQAQIDLQRAQQAGRAQLQQQQRLSHLLQAQDQGPPMEAARNESAEKE